MKGTESIDFVWCKILNEHIKKLHHSHDCVSFVIHVVQSGCGEHCTPRVNEFAPVFVFFVQPHLFGFVVGIVRVHRFLQRNLVAIQTQIDLIVQKVHPFDKGFAFVQIGGNRILVQQFAKCVSDLMIGQK